MKLLKTLFYKLHSIFHTQNQEVSLELSDKSLYCFKYCMMMYKGHIKDNDHIEEYDEYLDCIGEQINFTRTQTSIYLLLFLFQLSTDIGQPEFFDSAINTYFEEFPEDRDLKDLLFVIKNM